MRLNSNDGYFELECETMDECDLVKAMELTIQQLQDVIEIAPGMCRILLNRCEGLLIFVSSRSREHFRQVMWKI